jgi:hypothetical protein
VRAIHATSAALQRYCCDGKSYAFGTGGTALVSDDGWTWLRGANPPRSGMAPDVIPLGDRYYVYVAANIGAQPKAVPNSKEPWTLSAVGSSFATLTGFDPKSDKHRWNLKSLDVKSMIGNLYPKLC